MKLIYSQIAAQQIKKLSPVIKSGIRETLEHLKENPLHGKSLQRDLSGFRSLPFKRYRIIYKVLIEKKQIYIYTVEHRESVYENASRLLMEQKKKQ